MTDKLKVLIVDDSPKVRDELREIYHNLGHEVIGFCENGLEAIEKVKEISPDLVSLDIIMPEMDGIETYRILRNMDSPPKCLIVSALGSDPRVVSAYEKEIKVSHYCPKPVEIKLLAEKIKIVMKDEPMPLPESDDQDSERNMNPLSSPYSDPLDPAFLHKK